MATCAQCGATVDEPDDASAEEPIPCSRCGSLGRVHEAAATLAAGVRLSASGTVERGLNDTRLGVLGLLIAVGMGSAGLASPAGWEVALPVGLLAGGATALMIRWRRARHLLMEAAHRLTGR